MINKERLYPDFWKCINLHYEKECYEDVLKDACFYLIELIQNKSENYDMDGEKLITYVFSEKNPKLLINKNQTISEQDEQRGYGFLIRGLICSIRNPLSHSKNIEYSKEKVDSILMFINDIILPKLDDTKEFGYVDNWFEFVFVENTNDGEKYSNKILDNISKKDRFELMKEIVEKLDEIEEGKYKYFINRLYNELTIKSKNEIIILLNRKLIKVQDDHYLRMFFNHFDPKIWKKLDELVTARIEEIVFDSIKSGRMVPSPFTDREELPTDSYLSTWVTDWIESFSNYDEIIECLISKLDDKSTGKYALEYFCLDISKKEVILKYSKTILRGLKNGKTCYKELLDEVFLFDDEPEYEIFKKDYESFKESRKEEILP